MTHFRALLALLGGRASNRAGIPALAVVRLAGDLAHVSNVALSGTLL